MATETASVLSVPQMLSAIEYYKSKGDLISASAALIVLAAATSHFDPFQAAAYRVQAEQLLEVHDWLLGPDHCGDGRRCEFSVGFPEWL